MKRLEAWLRRLGGSLRGRLLIYLIGPLLLLLVLGIAVDHRVMITPISSAFDRSLARAATAITANIHRRPDGGWDVLMPNRPPPPPLRSTMHEQFFFRVSTPDGQTIAGTPDLPIIPNATSAIRDIAYGDIIYRGQPLRVVSYRTDEAGAPLVVTAAETPHRRDRAMQRMDIALGLNDIVQMLLTLGVAVAGIAIGLRPLRRLQHRIANSSPQTLEPVTLDNVPSEIQPLVDSLNHLLATVRDSSLAQQHFLANAAHQLRTPLTGLKAQLEVLAREASPLPKPGAETKPSTRSGCARSGWRPPAWRVPACRPGADRRTGSPPASRQHRVSASTGRWPAAR